MRISGPYARNVPLYRPAGRAGVEHRLFRRQGGRPGRPPLRSDSRRHHKVSPLYRRSGARFCLGSALIYWSRTAVLIPSPKGIIYTNVRSSSVPSPGIVLPW